MKKLIPLLFCLVTANAFASSADSGVCPWKLPFTIAIHGVGVTDSNEHYTYIINGNSYKLDTDYGIKPSSEDFLVTVDSVYLLTFDSSDLMHCSLSVPVNMSNSMAGGMTSLIIRFAPGNDSIISLFLSVDDTIFDNTAQEARFYNDRFQISGLIFNDTSIYATDSSYLSHNIKMTMDYFHGWDGSHFGLNGYDLNNSDFTASSVTLSGLFRPTTFSTPAAVENAPPTASLDIQSSNGSIACSFDVSDHARELEIYSPLGIRLASIAIPPEETRASLPPLQPGFYFLRLDGAVKKLLVGQ